MKVSSFSEAVYSDHKKGGDYNERVEGEKSKGGEGRHVDRGGGMLPKVSGEPLTIPHPYPFSVLLNVGLPVLS